MKRLIAAGLVVVCFAAASAQAGGYRFEVQSWELQTEGGLKRTMKRISQVAEAHCGVQEARDLRAKEQAQRCAAEVAADIVAKIDHPQLTAMAQEQLRLAAN